MNSILSFISNRSNRRASVLALLSLSLLPFVFFLPATLGRATLGDQDAIFYFLPSYKLVVEQVRSLQLPLWNPNVYSGMPLFAAWQAGVLDPLNWLYLALGVTGRSLSLVQQLSFCLALASTFIYAREIGLLRRAAFVSAIIYAFGGYLVARTLYPGLLHVASLMPLVLFFVERVSVRASRRMIVAGSFVIAWQLFAGHPQPFVYSALLALFYSIYRGSYPALRSTVVMFAMGAGLACVQWLPAWEFAQQSVRSEWSYEMFTQHSLHPASLLVSLIPYFHGQGRGIYQMPYWGAYWHHLEAQIYLGAFAISLAIAGVVLGWRVKFRPAMFWSIAGAVAVLLALGKFFPPLAYLIYQLPVIGNFRSPNRYWMIVALACAMLAGYAIDTLLRTDQKDVSRIVGRIAIGTSILIAVSVGVICLYILYMARWDMADAEFKVPVLSAAVSSAALWFFVRSKSRARLWPVLALLLIVDFGLYARYAPIWSGTKPEEISQSNHPESGRDTGSDEARSHIQLSVESGEFDPLRFYGIEMATGYDPLINARYKEFSGIDEAGHSHLKTLLSVNDRTLDVLSVRHVIAAPSFADEMRNSTRWREIRAGLFENLHVLPRAWLQRDVEPSNEYDRLRMIRGELEGFLPIEAAFTIRRRSPLSIELDANVDASSTLVLSETFWPGWHAKVNGQRTTVRRVDHVLRGIELDTGFHRVEMWYWPWTLTAGVAISIASLIICSIAFRRNL